jgi:hypothetical protein
MPFINFEEVEQLATIEELADMLGLKPSDTMLFSQHCKAEVPIRQSTCRAALRDGAVTVWGHFIRHARFRLRAAAGLYDLPGTVDGARGDD